ncbi:iron-containing alcohol dehydrogenase [Spirochaetota bacterium]
MLIPENTLIPQQTVYKPQSIDMLGRLCAQFGANGIIVHGRSLERSGKAEKISKLFGKGAAALYLHPGGEPTLDDVDTLTGFAREKSASWIAGIGGGSVIDLSKASAGLFNAEYSSEHYQAGNVLEKRGIPFIAVPTTAGTGSEATKNSVIINKKTMQKLSIRDDSFTPVCVVLDALLLKNAPKEVIAHAGMDALTQAIESYFSTGASWFSDCFALKAFGLVISNLEDMYVSFDEEKASELLLGSYFAGIALANARLGVVHGLAHPLGALYDLPHGYLCAFLLPYALELNKSTVAEKYSILSENAGGDLLEKVHDMNTLFSISNPFKDKEIKNKNDIIQATVSSGSTKANPVRVTENIVNDLINKIF